MADKRYTITQIRNFYSDGLSYLNVKFMNLKLSFTFQPFLQNSEGKQKYDSVNYIGARVPFDSAFVLYMMGTDILKGKEASNGLELIIQCDNNTKLKLERKPNTEGKMETWLTASNDKQSIPFKFSTHEVQVMENGVMNTKVVESGLGVFVKTIEGYLTGINASRHLNKLTDDYVKSLGDNAKNNNRSYQINRKPGNTEYKAPIKDVDDSSYQLPF